VLTVDCLSLRRKIEWIGNNVMNGIILLKSQGTKENAKVSTSHYVGTIALYCNIGALLTFAEEQLTL
jgi:hypothetical protein